MTSRKTILRLALVHSCLILIVALLTLMTACGNGSEASPTPSSATSSALPTSTFPAEPQEVDIGTGPALVWGSGEYGVVLVHGAIYDAASWTAQAEAIADAGFAVISIENATVDDVRAAMDYLRRTFGSTHVGLVGASAGTGPVLSVATDQTSDSQPHIDVVIVLAGSGNVDELDVPSVLFISAEGDGAATSARQMMEATSGDADDLVLVPGSAHAQALFNEPEGDRVLEAIIERLAERQSATESEP